MDILPLYGAIPSLERVVIDGKLVTVGGVTSGIDGSLLMVSLLRGETVAMEVQLLMSYSPQPPFDVGTPGKAPPAVLDAVTRRAEPITAARMVPARAYQAARFGERGVP